MNDTRPFPWAEAMAFGLGVLKLAPEAFWAMTPRELAAAIRAVSGPAPPSPLPRPVFETLARAFPDVME